MQQLINKYLTKLEAQGLAYKENALFLALDAELFSNKPIEDAVLELSTVFDYMNINTILFSEPAEPYWSIIKELTSAECGMPLKRLLLGSAESTPNSKIQNPKLDRIIPIDCETRTFFHDIPVLDAFSAEAITKALSHRKSAIIRDRGIVTYGSVTPEQAFVSFSSTCFSMFVKYFYDSLLYLEGCHKDKITPDKRFAENFNRIAKNSELRTPQQWALTKRRRSSERNSELSLLQGPPEDEDDVNRILSEAGRKVVEHRLVDSYFGNISYSHNNRIYISQTGSSMDELECCIDAVPLDGSSSVGITASSELSAHKNIYLQTGNNAILHGHPKFSVIMSMHCSKEGCDRSLCHKKCSEKRYISGVPIVSGEIGTGPTGLMNTVPEAMKEDNGVIVYGHGVFTSSRKDFNEAFDLLSNIENICRKEYFKKINSFL